MAKPGDAARRLYEAGLALSVFGEGARVASSRFGGRARKSGFEQGWKVTGVQVPADRPSLHWIYLPARALVMLVFHVQGRRMLAFVR